MPPASRKSTSAKKTTAKKSTAKKSTAKKSTAKTTAPKKTAAKRAPAKTTTAAQTPPAPAAPAAAPTPTPTPTPISSVGGASAHGAANLAAAGVAGAEEAVERIRGLQATMLDTARSGGAAYLQAYETALSSMLELTQGAAESSQLSWAVTLVNTYSDFVKRVNDAVLKAGRYTLG